MRRTSEIRVRQVQLVALDVLGTMGCFPKVPLLTDERCQHMSVDFRFGFPEG